MKLLGKNIIIKLFFIFFQIIPAQIIIKDAQTSLPLVDVNIYSNNTGTTTDSSGIFNLKIFDKSEKITFSLIGYRNITLPFNKIPKIIYLNNESIPMELVSVIGKNNRSRKKYMRLERNVRKVYPYAKKNIGNACRI